ncbi:MAG: GUN4 domain-containing protein [Cyanobacteria bacterium P01_A01_bin.84]
MFWNQRQLIHNGKYRIEKYLGGGGFALTYLATHTKLNRPVVIKTPNLNVQNDPDYPKYVQRFIKEGQILAKICADSHPNVVQVNDLFEENNRHCLVMQYIPGMSLWDLVRQQDKLPEIEAVRYIYQIGLALVEVHRKNLLHLDVTPLNIIINSESGSGKAVLIDFGIAADMSPPSTLSRSFGNRAFAPYELIRRGVRHPTVDIYCLAASLYYAITGKMPTNSLARKWEGEKLIPPQQIVSHVSKSCSDAIMWGMKLEAKSRPQSMQEWLNLLLLIIQSIEEENQYILSPHIDTVQLQKGILSQRKSSHQQLHKLHTTSRKYQLPKKSLKGDDLQIDLKLSFMEAVLGVEKPINMKHLATCKSCIGNGCDRCDRNGRISVTRIIKVTIPAGVYDSLCLRIPGEGNDGLYGGESGDLYFNISVEEDRELQRDDNLNILSEITITQSQAITGCELNIRTVDGFGILKLPAGIQNNKVVCIKNKGVPELGNPEIRGDQIVTVKVLGSSIRDESEIELKSEVEANYTKLLDLLKAQNWREADKETARLMLKVTNRKKEGWLDVESIKNFPLTDLHTIDRLWLKYSNEYFGFSIQKRIWLECGGKVDYETECRLGEAVGWRKDGNWLSYNNITFGLNASLGHLPWIGSLDLGCSLGEFFLGLWVEIK